MKEERNDDQVLVRLPKSTKDQIEMVARIEGMTTQEWIREAMKSRLCLQNICPNCSTVNTKKARFCNHCGTSLVESRRSMYRAWMLSVIREEFGEAGWTLKADDLSGANL